MNNKRKIFLIISYILLLSLFISGNILLYYADYDYKFFSSLNTSNYYKSTSFINHTMDDTKSLLKYSLQHELFCAPTEEYSTDNDLNLEKEIYINDFCDYLEKAEYIDSTDELLSANNNIINEYPSKGLKYKVKDLVNWNDYIINNGDNMIPVYSCLKNDGSYDYYYRDNYESLIKSKNIYVTDEDYSKIFRLEETIANVDGNNSESIEGNTSVTFLDGSTLDISSIEEDGGHFYRTIKKIDIPFINIKPSDFESIIDAANSESYINMNFEMQIEGLNNTINNINSHINDFNKNKIHFNKDNTNIRYLIKIEDRRFTNADSDYKFNQGYYFYAGSTLASIKGNIKVKDKLLVEIMQKIEQNLNGPVTMNFLVDTSLKVKDNYSTDYHNYKNFVPLFDIVIVIMVLTTILFALSFRTYYKKSKVCIRNKSIKESKIGVDLYVLLAVLFSILLIFAGQKLLLINSNIFGKTLSKNISIIYAIALILAAVFACFNHIFKQVLARSASQNLFIKKIAKNLNKFSKITNKKGIIIIGLVLVGTYNIVAGSTRLLGLVISAIIINIIFICMVIKEMNNE